MLPKGISNEQKLRKDWLMLPEPDKRKASSHQEQELQLVRVIMDLSQSGASQEARNLEQINENGIQRDGLATKICITNWRRKSQVDLVCNLPEIKFSKCKWRHQDVEFMTRVHVIWRTTWCTREMGRSFLILAPQLPRRRQATIDEDFGQYWRFERLLKKKYQRDLREQIFISVIFSCLFYFMFIRMCAFRKVPKVWIRVWRKAPWGPFLVGC